MVEDLGLRSTPFALANRTLPNDDSAMIGDEAYDDEVDFKAPSAHRQTAFKPRRFGSTSGSTSSGRPFAVAVSKDQERGRPVLGRSLLSSSIITAPVATESEPNSFEDAEIDEAAETSEIAPFAQRLAPASVSTFGAGLSSTVAKLPPPVVLVPGSRSRGDVAPTAGRKEDFYRDAVLRSTGERCATRARANPGKFFDASAYHGRSFRVGWGPGGILAHTGRFAEQPRSNGRGLSLSSTIGPSVQSAVVSPSLSIVTIRKVRVSPFLVNGSGTNGGEDQYTPFIEVNLASKVAHFGKDGRAAAGGPAPVADRADAVKAAKIYTSGLASALDSASLKIPASGGNRAGVISARRDVEQSLLIWRLFDALWGAPRVAASADAQLDVRNIDEALAVEAATDPIVAAADRKHAVSQWLADAAGVCPAWESAVETDNKNEPATDATLGEILELLVRRQVPEACAAARAMKDYRLAMLLAQTPGGCLQSSPNYLRKQLDEWYGRKAHCFINRNRLKLYALLAGEIVWPDTVSSDSDFGDPIRISRGLDWRRSFALQMWYALPPHATLGDAIAAYDEAVDAPVVVPRHGAAANVEFTRVPPPLPLYLESESDELLPIADRRAVVGASGSTPVDTCYRLLRLHQNDRSDSSRVLVPESATAYPLDCRMSWLLNDALQSCEVGCLEFNRREQLHVDFASQLECAGLWHLAVYVLLHLTDPSARECAVREVLDRHGVVDCSEEDATRHSWLREKLGIRSSWIHAAAALKSKYERRLRARAMHLLDAGMFNEAHRAVLGPIASEAILAGRHRYLGDLLRRIQDSADDTGISGWQSGGSVFLGFIDLLREFQDHAEGLATVGDSSDLTDVQSQIKLDEWRRTATELANRVTALPAGTRQERLCRSEMSHKIIAMFAALGCGTGGSTRAQERELEILAGSNLAGGTLLAHLTVATARLAVDV